MEGKGSDNFPGELLHIAARYDNIDLLKQLSDEDEKTNISSYDDRGRTALHIASEMNSIRCLKELIKRGIRINSISGPDDCCSTPLHHAARCGNLQCIDILLAAGAVIHISDCKNRFPKDLAIQESNTDCIELINRVSIERENQSLNPSERELFDACIIGNFQRVADMMAQFDEKTINTIYDDSYTLLHRAIQSGKKETVDILLRHGAVGTVNNHTGLSPLHMACERGFADIANLLLFWFPHLITFQSKDGNTSLHLAASHGHLEVMKSLLAFRYDFTSYDNHEAIVNILEIDKVEVVTPRDEPALKRWNINVNTANNAGMTTLHTAALAGQAEAVKMLLAAFKIIGRQDAKNDSQRGLGQRGSIDELQFINIEARSKSSSTPLHEAVNNGNLETIKVLLDAGANPNALLQSESEYNSRKSSLSLSSTTSALGISGNRIHPSSPIIRRQSFRQDMSKKHGLKSPATPLSLACDKGFKDVIYLLLQYKAKDVEHNCLHSAIDTDNDDIVSIFLVHHGVQIDREFKVVNIKARMLNTSGDSVHCPNTAVSIDWQGLRLPYLNKQWLVAAANCLNKGLLSSQMLVAITKLDLSSNHLKKFPFDAMELTSLRILNLNNNFIGKLDLENAEVSNQEYMSKFSRIEDLMLANNCLESVSSWLFHLPHLKALNLSNNKITELPYDMWIAPQLRLLNVSSNSLRELPLRNSNPGSYKLTLTDSFERRYNSETLDEVNEVEENEKQITNEDQNISIKLPCKQESVKNMEGSSGLDSISTRNDVRITIGDDKTNVYGQKSLSLSLDFDQADSISQSSGEMTPIITRSRRGDLINERVTNVENENERILDSSESPLFVLNLAHNQLTEIPEALACLAPNLTQLIISHNNINQLPIPAMMPAMLKLLDVSHNNVGVDQQKGQSTPPSLVSCYSYRATTLRRKSYTAASSWVHNFICRHRRHDCLVHLKTLDVSFNQIFDLDLLLEEVPNEETLKKINEDNNDSTKGFVKTIYPSLKSLDIANNRLRSVPKGVPYLSILGALNLSYNAGIVSLPPEMGLLTKLWELSLDGLRLHDPPPSILEQKKAKVVTGYLLSRLQKSKPYRRMKLMFVGLQCIGKTSLLQRLKYGSKRALKVNQSEWIGRLTSYNQKETFKHKKVLKKGSSMSTVGVDLGEWTCSRRKTTFYKFGSLPEIKFSTWDFGGQKEYYATHQCFLSRRSLYILVWKMTDGEKGIQAMESWLVNIQARAPDSPVLIIGTHYDLLSHEQRQNDLPRYRKLIRKMYTCNSGGGITNAREAGLPQVITMSEVSCKTGYGIKKLRALIYDTAYNLKVPGSKDVLLLEQLIPASYLALEEAVLRISVNFRYDMKVPVLTTAEFRSKVAEELLPQGMKFRDMEELRQATKFLHDNGILLHYDDPTLCDLYFIDPQWLCDMLAHVVTIHTVNPFVKDGIMMISDMEQLFRSDNFPSSLRYQYISLLSKFEVALVIDNNRLLIPSLLPEEEPGELSFASISENSKIASKNTQDANEGHLPSRSWSISSTSSIRRRGEFFSLAHAKKFEGKQLSVEKKRPPDPCKALRRQYLMSYCPSGFWPRLMSRMMADENLIKAAKRCCTFDDVDLEATDENEQLLQKVDDIVHPIWSAWQNGIRLICNGVELLRICERKYRHYDAKTQRSHSENYININRNNNWRRLNISHLYMIEVYVPDALLLLRKYATAGSLDDVSDEGLFSPKPDTNFSTAVDLGNVNVNNRYLTSNSNVEKNKLFFPRRSCEIMQKEVDNGEDGYFLKDAIVIDNIDTVPTYYPIQACARYASTAESIDNLSDHLYETNCVEGNAKTSTHRLYALCVEHIDTLLEDWYPGLGGRGLTTITGDPLIRRLVPCPYCVEFSDSNVNSIEEEEEPQVPIKRSHTIGEFGFKQLQRVKKLTTKKEICKSTTSLTNSIYDSATEISSKPDGEDSEKNNKSDDVFASANDLVVEKESSLDRSTDQAKSVPSLLQSEGQQLQPSINLTDQQYDSGVFRSESGEGEELVNNSGRHLQYSEELVTQKLDTLALPDEYEDDHLNQGNDNRVERRNHSVSNFNANMPVPVHTFMFEECVLHSSKSDYINCPLHGTMDMKFVAPDVIFHDLAPDLMINPDMLTKDYLLGKGAFGSVFKGDYYDVTKLDDPPIPVAIKMMAEQGIGESASTMDIAVIEAANKVAATNPTATAYNAYRAARQELSILVSVSHPNIVSIIGFCLNPLSLVLPLAPDGSLDVLLSEYRKHGCHLDPLNLKHIIVQVASAIEYLHHHKIIYRDLKSENVLVWSVPSPIITNDDESCETIAVKLADYGISRSMLPTGTKGFSGTPGFMAPEIIKYGGEEVYTEKIDSFSFGIFIYELLTLKQPFEEIPTPQVNEYILDGKRPQYSRQRKYSPLMVLDLMRWCWSQDPSERPSFTQILDVANNSKFLRLVDYVQFITLSPVTCGVSFVPVPNEGSDAKTDETTIELSMEYEIWLGYGETNYGEINVLQFDNGLIMNEERIVVGKSAIVSICIVDETIWVGSQGGCLHIFNSTSHQLLLSKQITEHYSISVTAIVHIPNQHLVIVALSDGKLISYKDVLVTNKKLRSLRRMSNHEQNTGQSLSNGNLVNSNPPASCWPLPVNYKANSSSSSTKGKSSGKHTLSLAEYCNVTISSCVYSILYIESVDDFDSEIWCGLSNGQLSILNYTDLQTKCNLSVDDCKSNIIKLTTNTTCCEDTTYKCSNFTVEDMFVWAVGQYSDKIYSWALKSREPRQLIDLSKVDFDFPTDSVYITSLLCMDHDLYVGCNNGCMVIISIAKSQIVTLFHCHLHTLYTLLPLKMIVKNTTHYRGIVNRTSGGDPNESVMEIQAKQEAVQKQQLIVTCGKGFYDPMSQSKSKSNGTNLLLWIAEQWN